MARIRTTKKLAQRIDRAYLKRLYPIPLWRRILTIVLLVAGIAWLGIYAVARDQSPYTSGALSPKHAFLEKNCASCHGANVAAAKRVTDQQCTACHEGPAHQKEQASTPACVSCHLEHHGEEKVLAANDEGCVACHAALKTKSGKHTVLTSVENFERHPQFAAFTARRDATNLKFNHQKHVDELSQKCTDCHSADQARTIPFAHVSSRALLPIPTYAATCAPCHPLTVDDAIPDAAPHDKPEVVQKFMVDQLKSHGMAAKIPAAEKKMWQETCARCHQMTLAEGDGLPVLAPTAITQRWLPRAAFDHSGHQAVACGECHPKAAKSTNATDLLLPGIETCRQCHNAGVSSAGSTCSVCHVYHDWSKAKGVDGKFRLSSAAAVAVPAPPVAAPPAK